eukprot:GHRR01003471.1.p1 GENE.GHRR01003471.1~~GHRR01003471.1.p1  ORF type:complete len:172 (+),score=26.98 GHRR01003471.1:246-761(+)
MDGDDVNGLTHHEEEAICEEDEEVVELLDDRPMKVHDGLYIGSYMAERNLKSLRKAGITDILQVAQGLFPHHPLVFNYMNIQVQDSPSEDLVVYFSKCFEFINSAINKGGRCWLSCIGYWLLGLCCRPRYCCCKLLPPFLLMWTAAIGVGLWCKLLCLRARNNPPRGLHSC